MISCRYSPRQRQTPQGCEGGSACRTGHHSRGVLLWHSAPAFSLLAFLLMGGTGPVRADGEKPEDESFNVAGMDTLLCEAFSPDGKMLAVGGGPWHGPGMLAVYDFPSGRRRFLTRKHRLPVWSVAFSPDSTRLAAGGGDGENKVWSVGGRLLADFEGHRSCTFSVCFTADGRRLITGANDNMVRVWDATTARPQATFRFPFKDDRLEPKGFPELPRERAPLSISFENPILQVYQVALSPDGKTIAAATEEKVVRLWEPGTGKGYRTLRTDHPEGVVHVTFSPDGKILATGGCGDEDGTVRLWDLATGRKLRTFRGHRDSLLQIVFSPDSKTLITCSTFPDSTAKVWQVATGKELATLHNRDEEYGIYKVAVSPDGKTLATVGGPNSLMFWDLQTGKEVRPSGPGKKSAVP